MAPPILDLSSADNWVKVHEVLLTAQDSPIPNFHSPIPTYTIPTPFDRRILAVGASSSQTKPSWRLAFFLSTIVQVPGIGSAENGSIFIPLGLTLIETPPYSDQYSVRIRIPRWHLEMSMTFWQYVGIELNALDLLDQISSRVS